MKMVIILISKVPLAWKALMRIISISEGSMGKKNIEILYWKILCFSVKNAQLFAKETP